MDTEIKKEWCVELRSNKFTQARNEFRDCKGGFCCLAVLSDLYIRKTQKANWGGDDGITFKHETAPPSHCTDPVWDWAGLNYEDKNRLIELNDTKRYTFDEIANYIEANL